MAQNTNAPDAQQSPRKQEQKIKHLLDLGRHRVEQQVDTPLSSSTIAPIVQLIRDLGVYLNLGLSHNQILPAAGHA